MSPLKPIVVRTRRATIILVAAAALALPVGAYQLGHRVEGNTNFARTTACGSTASWHARSDPHQRAGVRGPV
jgi:hypothetical protein